MSVNRYDTTTGRPIFDNGDAPDIKVDPGAAATYAEEVGNRIVKANIAALEAYPYRRAGLMGHALDTKKEYVHTGTGWVAFDGGTVINLDAFSANWSQTSGQTSFLVARGNRRFMHAVASRGAGGSLASILTVPAGHRPATNLFLAGNVTSGGSSYALQVQSNGIVWIPYGGGSSAAAYPLVGSWEVA